MCLHFPRNERKSSNTATLISRASHYHGSSSGSGGGGGSNRNMRPEEISPQEASRITKVHSTGNDDNNHSEEEDVHDDDGPDGEEEEEPTSDYHHIHPNGRICPSSPTLMASQVKLHLYKDTIEKIYTHIYVYNKCMVCIADDKGHSSS